MGRAVLLALVTLASGLLLYWLLAPRFAPPASSVLPVSSGPAPVPASSAPSPASSASISSGNPTALQGANINTVPGVETPRSAQQRESDDREIKRSPYYRWIRENLNNTLAGWQPSPRDPATLELYTARDDQQVVAQLLSRAVQPFAAHYGFNHVVFYLPNPSGSVEHYRLDAEAQYDSGSWQLFRK